VRLSDNRKSAFQLYKYDLTLGRTVLPKVNKSSAVAEMGNRLATVDMGRKVMGLLCPPGGWVGSPSNTVWPGPRPTSIPSGILIHLTVWPQYHNTPTSQTYRTDREDKTDRQRSDSIGRSVLQTVAQK